MDANQPLNKRLARQLLLRHPLEAARLLEGHGIQEEVDALLGAEVEVAAEVLRLHEGRRAVACLVAWPEDRRTELLTALDPSLAARLLRSMDPRAREAVLSSCPEKAGAPVRRLLKYPEGTGGALMDPAPTAAPEDLTVAAALELIRHGRGEERNPVYVVTRGGILVGSIEVGALVRAPQDVTVGAMMSPVSARLPARSERTAILSHPGWRNHHSLPVVDRNDVLIGVLGYRALRELEGGSDARREDPQLGLAMAGMYWTVMSALVDGVFRALTPREVGPQGKVRP